MADEHRSIEEARRRRAGVEDALHGLERSFASPADGRTAWSEGLSAALAVMLDAWAHHADATEQEDGLFDDVLTEAPHLAHKVDQLRQEHEGIAHDIAGTLALAQKGESTDHAVAALQDATLALMGRIVRHRHLGASVVYDAFSVDIQAAD